MNPNWILVRRTLTGEYAAFRGEFSPGDLVVPIRTTFDMRMGAALSPDVRPAPRRRYTLVAFATSSEIAVTGAHQKTLLGALGKIFGSDAAFAAVRCAGDAEFSGVAIYEERP